MIGFEILHSLSSLIQCFRWIVLFNSFVINCGVWISGYWEFVRSVAKNRARPPLRRGAAYHQPEAVASRKVALMEEAWASWSCQQRTWNWSRRKRSVNPFVRSELLPVASINTSLFKEEPSLRVNSKHCLPLITFLTLLGIDNASNEWSSLFSSLISVCLSINNSFFGFLLFKLVNSCLRKGDPQQEKWVDIGITQRLSIFCISIMLLSDWRPESCMLSGQFVLMGAFFCEIQVTDCLRSIRLSVAVIPLNPLPITVTMRGAIFRPVMRSIRSWYR